MNAVDLGKKAIVIITGASRGIGRTIAVELSRNLNQNSIFILIARSGPGLEETKSLVHEVDKSLTVELVNLDLSKPDLKQYETIFTNLLAKLDTNGVEQALIFHNAGTTDELKEVMHLTDLEQWRKHYDINVFSTVLLNSVVVKVLRPVAPRLVVVNITSLCGRVPFTNLAMYGSSKASRELLFKVFAIEEPNILVLNYSPGPVDTDMFNGIIKNAESEEVRKNFGTMKESTVLTPVQTVSKLLSCLEKGDFKSGDTIDYYERI